MKIKVSIFIVTQEIIVRKFFLKKGYIIHLSNCGLNISVGSYKESNLVLNVESNLVLHDKTSHYHYNIW